MYFLAVCHKDEGSAYGVHFPDVPGCFSAADNVDALVPSAREALSLYFEDEPLITPRSIDAIKTSGEIDEDLAAGAFLVVVPYIPRGGAQEKG